MTLRQRFATFVLAGSLVCVGALTVDSGVATAADLPTRSPAATIDQVAISAAAALSAVGTNTFAVRLDDVASNVALRVGADGARLRQAWAAADPSHQIALLSALTQVGVPYRRNASKPGVGFDCSGLTAYAWGQTGIELARHSSTQLRNAAARQRDTAQPGDLVYYPGHVMIWLGVDDLIVHAVGRGRKVEVGDISDRRVKRVKFGNPIG
jgi:cell wall-associated NlpC family hydrolase